jgi:hypothetical protein
MHFASYSPSISCPATSRFPRVVLLPVRRAAGLLARMVRSQATRKPPGRAPLSERERILISNLSALR